MAEPNGGAPDGSGEGGPAEGDRAQAESDHAQAESDHAQADAVRVPRKRKARGTDNAAERASRPDARERMRAGYAKAEVRNQEAREALDPLAEGERPLVVTIGAVVSALIAISVVVGYLIGTKVNGEPPKFAQVAAPTLIMGVMAWGMWRAKYWAVLGFQLVLVFLIFAAFYGLTLQASTVPQFAGTGGLLLVSGAFFFFMVKAMARIQMPNRLPPE